MLRYLSERERAALLHELKTRPRAFSETHGCTAAVLEKAARDDFRGPSQYSGVFPVPAAGAARTHHTRNDNEGKNGNAENHKIRTTVQFGKGAVQHFLRQAFGQGL